MNRHFHGASHLGRGGIELSLTPSSYRITRSEVEKLETLIIARLNIAMFHRQPSVRIQELQKQILMLKTMKASL
jgi:hypothetical protein